jgi:hypothetical protein
MNTNENKEMLWELLRDNQAFKGLTNTQYNNVITIFNTTLNQTTTANKPLMELNKEFISSMLQQLNSIKSNTLQDNVKNNIVDPKVLTHQEIQKQKRSEFENNLEKRQSEFTKYMKIHVPDTIDFGDNIKEEPISNVDSLIHEKMKERSYDIFDKQEEKTLNENGTANNGNDTTNSIKKEIKNMDSEPLIKDMSKEMISSNKEEILIDVKSNTDDNININNNIQKEENIIIQNLIKRIEVLEETQQEMKAHMNEIQEKMLENIDAIQEQKIQVVEKNIENTIENIHNNNEE